ncbi:DUF3793 family protein [Anaerosinus massiliensis]|uniref:DUF3793 family protein n=1 Tax=Massilibacillus massiliensis TaxID=1806837 RepID=UPI000A421C29|nr:DUF3793 family protein [Massilibacillus massiliensis]
MKEDKHFERLLAFHCAPTLVGIKSASLISCAKDKFADFFSLLQEYECCLNCKDIFFFVLSNSTKYTLILVYRKSRLQKVLNQIEGEKILTRFGYKKGDSIESHLNHLKIRMSLTKTFPHEIGLFLGYPAEDVSGFIEHKGQNFKLCGYWKVYSDEIRAKALFEKYTKCTNVFCKHLSNGTSIKKLLKAI